MVVHCDHAVHVFEFKLCKDAPEGKALAQLRDKGYADKYRHLGKPIHLIGVEFSSARRTSWRTAPRTHAARTLHSARWAACYAPGGRPIHCNEGARAADMADGVEYTVTVPPPSRGG